MSVHLTKISKNSSIKQSSSPNSRDHETLRELTSSLRDKNDILEAEFCKMKADQVSWDFERNRLLRELEVLDEKLKDLTRELGSRKESETNAIKRHSRAVEYSREVEAKMEALQRCFEEERGEFTGKLSVLKDELMERELELKESREMNKVLEAELRGLRVRNEELGKIEAAVQEKDEEIWELRRRNEELLKRIEDLENEKMEIVNYKDGELEELRKEKEGLETVIMTIDEKTEEMFLKLQVDVVTQFRSKANRCVKFRTCQVEKALSLIEDALDEQLENGVIVKGEVEIARNLDAEPAFGSHVNVLKCQETVKTTVLSSEEPIQISDSDDDETSRHVSGLKRARASSVYSSQKLGDDTSSDGSQNPKRKMKKFECVLGEVATIRKWKSMFQAQGKVLRNMKAIIAQRELDIETLQTVVLPNICAQYRDLAEEAAREVIGELFPEGSFPWEKFDELFDDKLDAKAKAAEDKAAEEAKVKREKEEAEEKAAHAEKVRAAKEEAARLKAAEAGAAKSPSGSPTKNAAADVAGGEQQQA